MRMYNLHGLPHAIKLPHVYRERQAAGKLLRQFFQRIGVAREEGDLRTAARQRDRVNSAVLWNSARAVKD